MFTIIGCLGSVVGTANSTEQAIAIVTQQIPISTKTMQRASTAVSKLSQGREYQLEYGGSGCTIRRM